MTYRDEAEASRSRLRDVERELEGNERTAAELAAEADRLRAERDAIDRSLGARRSLPVLDQLQIASPCQEPWSAMKGDDRARHCDRCEQQVYDLSAMTRSEAEKFLSVAEGRVCVRFYKRFDGTVLTADCPEGVRRRRRRRVAGLVGLAAGATMLTTLVFRAAVSRRVARDTMGSIEATQGQTMQGEPPPPPAVMGTIAAPMVPSPPPSSTPHDVGAKK